MSDETPTRLLQAGQRCRVRLWSWAPDGSAFAFVDYPFGDDPTTDLDNRR